MSINMSKKKKKVAVIIGVIICLCLLFIGAFYVSKNKVDKNVNNKKVISQKTDVKKNEIDGFDIGVLTKDEFYKAMEVGKQYKGKSVRIEGVNSITIQDNNSEIEKIINSLITTPYHMVIGISKNLTEKYIDVNNDNFKKEYIQQKEKYGIDLNTYRCMVNLVGKDDNFIKYTNIVLRVYGKNKTQVLQPIKVDNSLPSEVYNSGNGYYNSILGIFSAKDIVALEPQQLEIIVIYPDGKEVTQKFDYNKLNQL